MSWHAKPQYAYARSSTEAYENCLEIWTVLGNRGWTLNAVCGLLGNMGGESGYNPWRWEGDVVLASTDPDIDRQPISGQNNHGYGLVQFTPAGKYVHSSYAQAYPTYSPNYSDITGTPEDGEAQMLFLHEHNDYMPSSQYNWTYQEYIAKTDNTDNMTEAWFYNYERGVYSAQSMAVRKADASYWFTALPSTPPSPTPTKKKGMPLWMMTIPYRN